MSAQCNAAGMFPSENDQSSNLIPIHTVDYSEDYILNDLSIKCPRYERLLNEYQQSSDFKYRMSDHQNFIEYLERNSGRVLQTPTDVMYFITLLIDEQQHGLL